MEQNKPQHDFSEDDFYGLTDDDHKRMTYLFQLFSDAQGALRSGATKEDLMQQIELALKCHAECSTEEQKAHGVLGGAGDNSDHNHANRKEARMTTRKEH
jgi:hypothetical protein